MGTNVKLVRMSHKITLTLENQGSLSLQRTPMPVLGNCFCIASCAKLRVHTITALNNKLGYLSVRVRVSAAFFHILCESTFSLPLERSLCVMGQTHDQQFCGAFSLARIPSDQSP